MEEVKTGSAVVYWHEDKPPRVGAIAVADLKRDEKHGLPIAEKNYALGKWETEYLPVVIVQIEQGTKLSDLRKKTTKSPAAYIQMGMNYIAALESEKAFREKYGLVTETVELMSLGSTSDALRSARQVLDGMDIVQNPREDLRTEHAYMAPVASAIAPMAPVGPIPQNVGMPMMTAPGGPYPPWYPPYGADGRGAWMGYGGSGQSDEIASLKAELQKVRDEADERVKSVIAMMTAIKSSVDQIDEKTKDRVAADGSRQMSSRERIMVEMSRKTTSGGATRVAMNFAFTEEELRTSVMSNRGLLMTKTCSSVLDKKKLLDVRAMVTQWCEKRKMDDIVEEKFRGYVKNHLEEVRKKTGPRKAKKRNLNVSGASGSSSSSGQCEGSFMEDAE